jgi:hypothetical protein
MKEYLEDDEQSEGIVNLVMESFRRRAEAARQRALKAEDELKRVEGVVKLYNDGTGYLGDEPIIQIKSYIVKMGLIVAVDSYIERNTTNIGKVVAGRKLDSDKQAVRNEVWKALGQLAAPFKAEITDEVRRSNVNHTSAAYYFEDRLNAANFVTQTQELLGIINRNHRLF